MLYGQLDLSTFHLFQLAVDDRGEAVPDGENGRGGIECRWRLHAASFWFRVRLLNETNPCLPPMHRGAPAGLVRKTSPD